MAGLDTCVPLARCSAEGAPESLTCPLPFPPSLDYVFGMKSQSRYPCTHSQVLPVFSKNQDFLLHPHDAVSMAQQHGRSAVQGSPAGIAVSLVDSDLF